MAEKNNGFTFKQFHVKHDRCAMKVGTDSILLGAWADIAQADSILDLGDGNGVDRTDVSATYPCGSANQRGGT